MIRIEIVNEEPDPEEYLEKFQNFFTPATEPPFRDPESAGYFREVIRGEMDDDWYSIPTPEHDKVWDSPRMAFCDLNQVHKIALLMIDNSRKGIYTPFQLAGRIDENAWPYMASLPFDILICLQRRSSWGHFSREVDYQVSNYSYQGKEIELTVTGRVSLSGKEGDDFFTELEPHIMYGAGYGLCMGKDGRYYMDPWDFKRATEYYWLNDIPDTIAHLMEEEEKTTPILFMGKAEEYSLLDYAKLSLRSPFRLSRMGSVSRALGEEEDTEWICSVSSGEFGMKESEFPDIGTFKVINCLYSLPDIRSRKPVLFLIDRHADGSWSLGQTLTYKYPEFDELLAQVVCDLRTPDPERYILAVDSDEKLYGPEDFKDTICGFVLRQNSLEVLQKEIALNRFARALRRAESSGRYEIRNKWED